MKIDFEHHFREKVMEQTFAEAIVLESPADVNAWKAQWMGALKSWHSPYKVLLDASHLEIANQSVAQELEKMIAFFNRLFLKKIVAFGGKKTVFDLPWESHDDEASARKAVGMDKSAASRKGDFRSQIQIDNNFRQHVVEVSFAQPVEIDSLEKLRQLRAKLTNNLMQWHSRWNLFFDCNNVSFDPSTTEEFEKMVQFFSGLFLSNVVGYHPKSKEATYPFKVFRARHKAVLELEKFAQNDAGDEANCSTRKLSPSKESSEP